MNVALPLLEQPQRHNHAGTNSDNLTTTAMDAALQLPRRTVRRWDGVPLSREPGQARSWGTPMVKSTSGSSGRTGTFGHLAQ
jgi:hypothetical protein